MTFFSLKICYPFFVYTQKQIEGGKFIMKTKLLSICISLCMLLVMMLPVYAASSIGSWEFDMQYTLVDGNKNKEYHELDEGEMSLSGGVYAYSKDTLRSTKPNKIYFAVRESRSGIDRSVGTTSVIPSLVLDKKVTVKGAWGEQKAGKYYLQIYKLDDDGWNIKGAGILKTEKKDE